MSGTASQVTPATIAGAFHAGEQVYVAPGVQSPVNVSSVSQAAARHHTYVAVVPQAIVDQAGSEHAAVSELARAAGTGQHYVLVSPDGFGVWTPNGDGQQIYSAAAAQGGGPTAEVTYAIDHITGVAGGGGTSAAAIAVPVVVVLALLAVVVSWSRRRRQRVEVFRKDVQAEVDSLQDDLLVNDPAGATALPGSDGAADAAGRALQVAWSRQQAAAAMLARASAESDVTRARLLADQGRAALQHAQRLRDGVPGESEVYALAGRRGGPDPRSRTDAPSGQAGRQPVRSQWTVASYPGYGYGFYPGYGWGFFDYGGSFIGGLLAGELIDDAFGGWGYGGYDGGFGTGYDQGYDAGYDAGVDQGADAGGGGWGDAGGGDWGGGDFGGGGDNSGGGGW